MNSKLIGLKRSRLDIELETESKIYEKMKTPDISTEKINYFLSQIKSEYEQGINYTFSFSDDDKKLSDNIIAVCLWGHIYLKEGRIFAFNKKVPIDFIAQWANFGKMERTFDFFANIECLFNIDKDTMKKMSFFEDGKYGFIYEGIKDYYLIINIKSLNKFNYIDKNNEYCQYWMIKLDDQLLLDKFGLKSKNSTVNQLEQKIKDLKDIIIKKENLFEDERKEYNDRINKIIAGHEKELEDLKNKYDKEIYDKDSKIEEYKLDKINSIKRCKKFVGLEESQGDYFHIKDENNVISFEEVENDDKDDKDDKNSENNIDLHCILCCINIRNIFFDRCHHCCICDQCLEKCFHKFNKKTKQNEYFRPICNNDTQKDDNSSYTETKKIIFA